MNFREEIIKRFDAQMRLLVIDDTKRISQPDGIAYLTPNPGFSTPLQGVFMEPFAISATGAPLPSTGAPRAYPWPAAYLYLDSGRNDGAAATFITHLVETLAVRIDVGLSRKVGVREGDEVRPMTFQITDFLHDIQTLLPKSQLQSAVQNLASDVTVNDVYLEEWRLDDRFRGGDIEVLTLIYEIAVANPSE